MRKIVAAIATLQAQQLFARPQNKDPKQFQAEPLVNRGPHPAGCLMTAQVLQAEQRYMLKSVAAH